MDGNRMEKRVSGMTGLKAKRRVFEKLKNERPNVCGERAALEKHDTGTREALETGGGGRTTAGRFPMLVPATPVGVNDIISKHARTPLIFTCVAPARTKAPSNGSLSSGRREDSSSKPNTFT